MNFTVKIFQIPFPAVTVCPYVNLQTEYLNLTYVLETIKLGNISRLDYDSEVMPIIQEILFIVCPINQDYWLVLNCTESYSSKGILDALTILAPPIEDTILACGEDDIWIRICSHLFRRVFTEQGICYTFNGILPYDLYREDV